MLIDLILSGKVWARISKVGGVPESTEIEGSGTFNWPGMETQENADEGMLDITDYMFWFVLILFLQLIFFPLMLYRYQKRKVD